MNLLPLRNARHLAAAYLHQAIQPGDAVVDATMGNGYDTLFLAQLVGPNGRVDAFDVQASALDATMARLEAHGCAAQAQLHLAGHETMAQYIPCPVKAIVFNLGWLPGSDKRITTHVETTLLALDAALGLLLPGGILSLCAYPGHEEGAAENAQLRQRLAQLPPQAYNVLHHGFLNATAGAPELYLVQRQG